MTRILQISNKAPFPAQDGSSIAIYNMATGFISNGADLKLLSINTKKHFKPDSGVPDEFRQSAHYESVYRNTNTSAAGALINLIFSSSSYFVSRFYFAAFRSKLRSVLQQETFDVIQLEGLFMATYLPLIRKYSKARVVLRAHNVEHLIWDRHIAGMQGGLRRWYLRVQNKRLKRFEESVFSSVDAIVPISDADEKMIRIFNRSVKMQTCITGVDVAAYQKKKTRIKPNTVFYFGSMDWLPNQLAARWFLQHCWKQVLAAVPGARFVIAGRGMPLEFFHIVEPNVQIIEDVQDSSEFFASHQVMIVPLLSGSGLRIKIVEGMAYGKAIVSTSIGAEGIHVVNGEQMIIADDADRFTRSVIDLLRDPRMCEEMGRKATQYASANFDNKAVVARLLDFYRELGNG